MKNKFIIFFCACAFLFFTALNAAYSSESHHSIVYVDVPVETTTETITKYSITEGIALGYAFAGIDCNMSSDKWHGGVGGGFFDGINAPAIGLCKRWGNTMLKGAVGTERGKNGASIGIMFNFN